MSDQVSDERVLASILDLFRRLPCQNVGPNVELFLSHLTPALGEDIVSLVDQPLRVQTDSLGNEFLICDYNRDGDSYRSPSTNTYYPPIDDGIAPSASLRELEIVLNEAFDVYREMYYEGGASSVYLWDIDDGFAGVVLLRKAADSFSSWNAVHVFESTERSRATIRNYKLTSTIILFLSNEVTGSSTAISGGTISLAGSMTRQNELDAAYDPTTAATSVSSHVCNIGRAIEDSEYRMRNSLQEVYFSKTKEVVDSLRSTIGYGEQGRRMGLQSELVGLLKKKGGTTSA